MTSHLEQITSQERRETWLSSFDPRTRLLTAIALSVLLALSMNFPVFYFSLIAGLILWTSSELKSSILLKRVLILNFFILVLFVTVPWNVHGIKLFSVCGFGYSKVGFLKCIAIALRSNAILLVCSALLAGIDPVTLGHALRQLYVPKKLAVLLLLTVRYLEVLSRESSQLRNAMRARAFRLKNRLHCYRSIASFAGMLLVKSYDRSERVMQAMKCRGFRGEFHLAKTFSFKFRDWVFLGVAALLAIAEIAAEIWRLP